MHETDDVQVQAGKTNIHLEENAIQDTTEETNFNESIDAPAETSNRDKQSLVKLQSVVQDTKKIADIIDGIDKEKVYNKLSNLRNCPNRVELVTNELLEEQHAIAESTDGQPAVMISDDEDNVDTLFADIPKVLKLVKSRKKDKDIDLNRVYQLLEENASKKEKINIVADILCEEPMNIETSIPVTSTSEVLEKEPNESDIMDDVALVAKRYPSMDPNLIFEMLEMVEDQNIRVKLVMDKLSEQHPMKLVTKADGSSVNQDSDHKNDKQNAQLVKDTNSLAKIFPNTDKNEIYAYLEANFHNPRRVDIVMEELLQLQGSQNETDQAAAETPEDTENRGKEPEKRRSVAGTSTDDADNSENDISPIVQLQKDCETMIAIFPDCDPNYIFERLEASFSDPERVEKLSTELFERKNYPKLKERQAKEKKKDLRYRLIHMKFNLNEFLQMFEEPLTHFYDTSKPITTNYKAHCLAQLQNYFPMMQNKYIESKLVSHKHHFTPTLRELEKEAGAFFTGQSSCGDQYSSLCVLFSNKVVFKLDFWMSYCPSMF